MKQEIEVKLHYDNPDAVGTVTVDTSTATGPTIVVEHEGNRWEFLIDLFHLAPSGRIGLPYVQIVAYHPENPDDDPIQHMAVDPHGKVETFEL